MAEHASTTNMSGVTITEMTQPISSHHNDGKAVTNISPAHSSINEPKWDLQEMLQRWNYAGSFSWNTTQVVGTPLVTLQLPLQAIVSEIAQVPFQRFTYIRWEELVIKIQLNGQKFYQGQLIAFSVPYTKPAVLSQRYLGPDRINNATQLQHNIINATTSDVVELHLPFTYPQNWINMSSAYIPRSTSSLAIAVWNQLKVAVGTTPSLTGQIWYSMKGAEFMIPYKSLLLPPIITSSEEMREVRPQMEKLGKQLGGKVGKIASQEVFGGMDKIVEKILPENMISDLLDGVLGGLDKPSDGTNPNLLVAKSAQFLPHAINIEHIPRLSLYPSKLNLSDENTFSTHQDEMELRYILKRPSRYAIVNWATTDPEGKVLATHQVGPLFEMQPLAFGATRIITALSYASMMFNYWRGGLKLTVQGAVSAFNTGRLQLSYFPGIQGGVLPGVGGIIDSVTATSVYSVIIDVIDSKLEVDAHIPFYSPTEWKPIFNGIQRNEYASYEAFTGWIVLSVLTPLTSQPQIANNVDVNLLIAADDDYEVNSFTINNSQIFPFAGTPPAVRDVRPQMERVIPLNEGQAQATDPSTVYLGKAKAMNHSEKTPHFSETFPSLKDLMKRYTVAANVLATYNLADDQRNGKIPIVQIIPAAQFLRSDKYVTAGAISIFSPCYRFWRGALRFKFQQKWYDAEDPKREFKPTRTVVTQVATGAVATTPNLLEYATIFGVSLEDANYITQACAPPPVMGTGEILEFEVPFTHYKKVALNYATPGYESVNDVYNQGQVSNIVVVNWFDKTQELPGRFESRTTILHAIGDDFHFGTFLGVPPITVNPAFVGQSTPSGPNSEWLLLASHVESKHNKTVPKRSVNSIMANDWVDVGKQ